MSTHDARSYLPAAAPSRRTLTPTPATSGSASQRGPEGAASSSPSPAAKAAPRVVQRSATTANGNDPANRHVTKYPAPSGCRCGSRRRTPPVFHVAWARDLSRVWSSLTEEQSRDSPVRRRNFPPHPCSPSPYKPLPTDTGTTAASDPDSFATPPPGPAPSLPPPNYPVPQSCRSSASHLPRGNASSPGP